MYWIICKSPYHTSVAGPYGKHETALSNFRSFEDRMVDTNATYYLVSEVPIMTDKELTVAIERGEIG